MLFSLHPSPICIPTALLALSLALGAPPADAQRPPAPRAGASLPPGYDMARTGGMHDFDYFEGAWADFERADPAKVCERSRQRR
jgi:hypothetical protein